VPRLTLALACALSLHPLAAGADSLRCDGGIVSTGDSKLDLVAKCGWPALREERTGEHVTVLRERRGPFTTKRTVSATSERWTYDFGPRRFIEIVRLELGRVVGVERGGYGYERAAAAGPPALPRARCAARFHEGESAYEVLARCGEPAFRDARLDVRTRILEDGSVLQADSVDVTVELWTYDFGSSTFVRLLTFEDGRLVRIETGGYGYAR
jgi:hypothetical protein